MPLRSCHTWTLPCTLPSKPGCLPILQRRAEDSPTPRGGDSSEEEEEEALLAALAQQAAAFGTPLSLAPSQHPPQAFTSQLHGGSQAWQAGSSQLPGSPAATQEVSCSCRFCLACSAASH